MSLIMLVPFVWMILTAFKTVQESTSINPFVIFPASWKFENFSYVWKNYNFLILYKNTLLMIFFRVLCAVLTATMAGYAFGRLNFPGKNFFFGLVLVQMMVPPQIFLLPQYLMVSKMRMLNTQYGSSFCYLLCSFGAHVSAIPNQQTFCTAPLHTRANVACFGTFGYEMDLRELTEQELEEVRGQIRFMKEYRELLQFGSFYQLLSPFDSSAFFEGQFIGHADAAAALREVFAVPQEEHVDDPDMAGIVFLP